MQDGSPTWGRGSVGDVPVALSVCGPPALMCDEMHRVLPIRGARPQSWCPEGFWVPRRRHDRLADWPVALMVTRWTGAAWPKAPILNHTAGLSGGTSPRPEQRHVYRTRQSPRSRRQRLDLNCGQDQLLAMLHSGPVVPATRATLSLAPWFGTQASGFIFRDSDSLSVK